MFNLSFPGKINDPKTQTKDLKPLSGIETLCAREAWKPDSLQGLESSCWGESSVPDKQQAEGLGEHNSLPWGKW